MSSLFVFLVGIYLIRCFSCGWVLYDPFLPVSISGSSIAVYNDIIYLIGASRQISIEYDTTSQTSQLHRDFSLPEISGVSQFYTQKDNLLYIIRESNIVSRVEITPRTYEWDWTKSPQAVGSADACVASSDTHLFIVGGYNEGYLDTIQILNINTELWLDTALYSLYTTRKYSACIVLDDYLYTIGGLNADGYLSSIERLDVFALDFGGIWYEKSWPWMSLLTAVIWSRAISYENTIYVIGGQTSDGLKTNTVQVIDTLTESLTSMDPLPVAMVAMSAVVHAQGIYLFGGSTNTGDTKTIYYYNLVTEAPTSDPTQSPTAIHTFKPSSSPTAAETTQDPTKTPSWKPQILTDRPSVAPSDDPTMNPSNIPSSEPSKTPTRFPSVSPSEVPSKIPSNEPSNTPTEAPVNTLTTIETTAVTEDETESEEKTPNVRGGSTAVAGGLFTGMNGTQLTLSIVLLILSAILIAILVVMICWRRKQAQLIKEDANNIDNIYDQRSIYEEPNDADGDKATTVVKKEVVLEDKAKEVKKVSREDEDVMLAKALALSLAEAEEEERQQREMMQQYQREEEENDDAESQSDHESDDEVLKTDAITVGQEEIVDDYKQDIADSMDNPASANYYKSSKRILDAGSMEQSGIVVNDDTDSDNDILAGNDITMGGNVVPLKHKDDIQATGDLPDSDSDDDVLDGANINVTMGASSLTDGGFPALPTSMAGNTGEAIGPSLTDSEPVLPATYTGQFGESLAIDNDDTSLI